MIKKIFRYAYRNFYSKIFHKTIFANYETELKRAILSYKSLLNVGCGANSQVQSFSKKTYSIGVDAFKPSIEKSKKAGIHNKYYLANVMDIGKKFKENSFDVVLASDLIEHLKKKEGCKLIRMMEKIAKKRVIIFTPNGFLPQKKFENNDWQIHKSGWTAKEMKKKGYKIIGINGWEALRGEMTEIKFWPKPFWDIVSDFTRPLTRKFPKYAAQILCVKYLK